MLADGFLLPEPTIAASFEDEPSRGLVRAFFETEE